LNIDIKGQDTDEYQRLIVALIQVGWTYVRTSALVIETDDLTRIWQGMDFVARQSPFFGELSALTLNVQASENFGGVPYAATPFRSNALDEVLARPRNPA
jgi:hypothetical protein